jgi:hypothetical protein
MDPASGDDATLLDAHDDEMHRLVAGVGSN